MVYIFSVIIKLINILKNILQIIKQIIFVFTIMVNDLLEEKYAAF